MFHKKNIPNILSVIRILMVPVFVYLFLKDYPDTIFAAVTVFIIAGLTDVLDGYIARKYKYFTKLGLFLDPLADKLLQTSAFVCLYVVKLIPWWVVAVFVFKELMLGIGAALLFKKRNNIEKSNMFGKLSSVLVFAGVIIISLFGDNMSELAIDIICLIVLSGVILAFVIYLIKVFGKIFKRSVEN